MFTPVVCVFVFSLWNTFPPSQSMPCVTVEEGTARILTASFPAFSQSLVYEVKRNEQYVEVGSCDPKGICTDDKPDSYKLTYERTTILGSTLHMVHLLITNVSRSDAAFRTKIDGKTGKVCEVEVYAKPEKPSCDPPTLIVYNALPYLNLTCVTEKVFPNAKALLKYLGPKLPNDTDIKISYKDNASPAGQGYFETKVEHLVSLTGLLTGKYEFLVLMFPALANLTEEIALATANVVRLDVVNLEAPTVSLSEDCPLGDWVKEDYIMSGARATCKCKLAAEGYPPGHAQWYTEKEEQVGDINEEDGASTLTFSYNPANPQPTYECRAESVLVVPDFSTVHFSPKFAYGPNSVITELSSTESFDLCPSDSHKATVTCKVPYDEVTPQTFFSVYVDNDVVAERMTGKLIANFYVYYCDFRPSKGGNHRVSCKAENAWFSQLSVQKSEDLQVREPPQSPPVLTISNQHISTLEDNTAYITDGEDVIITCKVDGGFPQVSEVTLTCGSRSNKAQSKVVALELQVTKSLNRQTCYCEAEHPSNCYRQESMVTLLVQDAEAAESPLSDAVTIGIGAGVSGAVFLIILIVVIAFIVCRRGRRKLNADTVSHGHNNNVYNDDNLGNSDSKPYELAITSASGSLPLAHEAPSDHYDLIRFDTASTIGGHECLSDTDAWSVNDARPIHGDDDTYIDAL